MLALALVVALLGIIEYLVFAPYRIGSIFGSVFRGIRGNPNALGAYLGIFALISLSFSFNPPQKRRLFWLLAFLVFVLGLILTFSRSSWLGFLFGSIFLIWRSNKRILVFGMILLLLFSAIWLPGKVAHRASTIFETVSNKYLIHKFLNIDYRLIQTQAIERYGVYGYNMEVVSAALRYSAWRDGFDIFKRFPLLGSGYRLNKHFGRMITAENLYLDILATTGILGFLTFLWMGYKLIKLSMPILKKAEEPFHKVLASSYLPTLILLGIVSLTGSIFFDPKVLGAFWFLTGLISSIKYLK
jgi:O-antigen ligase